MSLTTNLNESLRESATRRDANPEGGSIFVIVLIFLIPMAGLVGLALDTGFTYYEERRMQIAADAGALAGVAKLVNAGVTSTQVTTEVEAIAGANGLGTGEITAGGGIDLGRWDPGTSTFTSGATPWNAVRVRARRTVGLLWAPLFNFFEFQPLVTSVAYISSTGSATCMVPFGLDDGVVAGVTYGSVLDISRPNAGNWGKLDIGGNMSSNPVFVAAMTNGVCSERLAIGDDVSPGTGFAGVVDGFNGRIEVNPIVILPVVNNFANGNSSDSVVVGFVAVELIGQGQGHGRNWSGQIRFLGTFVGETGGGPTTGPYAKVRVLVQ